MSLAELEIKIFSPHSMRSFGYRDQLLKMSGYKIGVSQLQK
jgi:hypothetical protein